MPPSWSEAFVNLIAKQGKDPSFPHSYRPISQLGVDYKILITIMAVMMTILDTFIHRDQSGFSKYRYLWDSIRQLTNNFCRDTKSSVMAMFVDVEKALDQVEWYFLNYALQKAGLGPVSCNGWPYLYECHPSGGMC